MENINNVINDSVDNIENAFNETNDLVEVSTEEEGQAISESPESHYDHYKMLLNMIKEMNSQYDMYKTSVYEHIKNTYSLSPAILDVMVAYSMSDIEEMTFDTASELKKKYTVESKPSVGKNKSYIDQSSNMVLEVADNSDLKSLTDMFKDIKELSSSLIQSKKAAEEIKNDAQEALDAYFKALESPELRQKRHERLQQMKERIDSEEDIGKKIEMKNKIKIMEESDNFSFLLKKFTDNNTDKFKRSIYESFFVKERGKYIMDRYFKRIGKFGFDEKLYKYFFNLEEKFLPEEYHPFNNLFLFVYMKYVGYADPYNKADQIYVKALTSAIANLVYHRYASNDKEAEFVEFIKQIDSFFMEYKDKFESDNTTHPKHELRLEMDAKYESDRKEFLINKMKDLKIENIDETLSANELQAYMNSEIDRMIELNKVQKDDTENEANKIEPTNENERESGSILDKATAFPSFVDSTVESFMEDNT